jgi:ABC-2 type transport system permease protein
MRNIFTIARKEIESYFTSPVAYLLMTLFGLLTAFVFYSAVAYFVIAGLRSQAMGQGQAMSVNDYVVGPVFSNISVFGLFLLPLITMRLFAEEKRTGTIELLLTSPIADWEIVIGKFIGAVTMYLCVLFLVVCDISLLFVWGSPDWRPILAGLLGMILQASCILAIGTFISSLTKNQIIAGAATFAVCLLLFVLNWVSSYNDAGWAQAIAYCSIMTHYEPFAKGIIDTKDVVFYLSFIFFGLFLTKRSLESLRWRA